jgi:hypothetical protein
VKLIHGVDSLKLPRNDVKLFVGEKCFKFKTFQLVETKFGLEKCWNWSEEKFRRSKSFTNIKVVI